MDNLPDYLYRPNDCTIFYKVDIDGKFMYIHENNYENGYKIHGYEYDTLIARNFKPCTKADFKELAARKKEYYEWLSWAHRPDGHGGCKGGTMEEYRNRKIYTPVIIKPTKNHELPEKIIALLDVLQYEKKEFRYYGTGQNTNPTKSLIEFGVDGNMLTCKNITTLKVIFTVDVSIPAEYLLVLMQAYGIVHYRYIYERIDAAYENFWDNQEQ